MPPNSHLSVQSTATPHTVPNPLKGKEQPHGSHHQHRSVPHAAPLDAFQLKQLKATMRAAFERTKTPSAQDPADLLKLLLTAKKIEGCSPRTIAYYRTTLAHMTQALAKPYTQVTSDDLRAYLAEYEQERAAGKVAIGNIRRIMSSCQMLEYI